MIAICALAVSVSSSATGIGAGAAALIKFAIAGLSHWAAAISERDVSTLRREKRGGDNGGMLSVGHSSGLLPKRNSRAERLSTFFFAEEGIEEEERPEGITERSAFKFSDSVVDIWCRKPLRGA